MSKYNDFFTFSRLLFIRSFLNWHVVTRTCIIFWMNSIFGHIGPTELAALEQLKSPHKLIMRKWCLHFFSDVFLLENFSKYFDDFACRLSGERSLPFGLLVLLSLQNNKTMPNIPGMIIISVLSLWYVGQMALTVIFQCG